MPAIHYRQLGNPFSNIFGTGEGTTTTSAATVAATSTLSSDNILTDPLGGLTSAIASILAPTTPTPSLVLPTTSSTSSIPTGTTTSPIVVPTTPPTTVDVTSTIPRAAQASATTSSSPSPSVSATPTSHNFTVAAVVVGVLVGLFALALVVSFFLRRWNRNRSGVNPRESINFSSEEFRRAGAGLANEREQKYAEQKVYNDSAYQVPVTPAPAEAYQTNPRAYPSEYMYQQQPPPQVYSPHPHHAYPSAAQQVAFEYRGEPVPPQPSPAQAAMHMEAYPNPHPVTHEDDAYGGI